MQSKRRPVGGCTCMILIGCALLIVGMLIGITADSHVIHLMTKRQMAEKYGEYWNGGDIKSFLNHAKRDHKITLKFRFDIHEHELQFRVKSDGTLEYLGASPQEK